MNLAYYSEFRSKNDTTYRVEIYINKTVSNAQELVMTSDPITVEWEADRLFKPLKMSNAVCSLLTKDILFDLYTGEAQGVELVLYNKTTGSLEWFGFITPNLYSSDYISLDTLDIEAIDSIACLDNIKYSYMGGKADLRSFIDIISYLLAKADPRKRLGKLYVHDCDRITKFSTSCILNHMYINERNFFDEIEDPMTCKDVLSSLVEYLGMTFIQWKDAYYMIDYEYLYKGYSNFTLFNLNTLSSRKVTVSSLTRNITDIGVASSNGCVSLDNVYNKVSVIANTNAVGALCPELNEKGDLENQSPDAEKYYTQTIGKTVFLSAYFKSKENWGTLLPFGLNSNYESGDISEITIGNVGDIYRGAFFQKTDSYSSDSPEPSSLDWRTSLTFCRKAAGEEVTLIGSDKLYHSYLTLKKKKTLLLNSGYLIIDFSYKLSQSYVADDGYNSPNGDAVYVSNSNNKYSSGYADTKFYCRLKIGDYYYNGEEWRPYNEYINNLDYYKVNIGFEEVNGVTKYYTYDAKNPSGTKKYITQSEYEKIYAKDRFLIIRKNNENDKIYDTWYTPTNQVSYKQNLSNSSDGALIRLPNFCLYGEIELELCPPTVLGGQPCHLTSGASSGYCYYCHIKDFEMKYTDRKYINDVFGDNLDETDDVIYSNTINDSYITEADDIELLVNSYAKKILSYSNVATKNDGKFDYLKSVYNRLSGGEYLPEQILINKLYRHHKTPKFIYKNTLNYNFSPFDMIKENSLNRTMIVNALGVNYSNDSVNVTLVEL